MLRTGCGGPSDLDIGAGAWGRCPPPIDKGGRPPGVYGVARAGWTIWRRGFEGLDGWDGGKDENYEMNRSDESPLMISTRSIRRTPDGPPSRLRPPPGGRGGRIGIESSDQP